jgi:phosphoglycerate dehydrogenase-like enzyme
LNHQQHPRARWLTKYDFQPAHADRVFVNGKLEVDRSEIGLGHARALSLMTSTAHLINVGRGKIVDEDALLRALTDQRIAAAGLDVTREEPLPASLPLWTLPNAFITSHVAGETQRYEDCSRVASTLYS